MKVNKTWTWSFYSRVYRHQNEIALAVSFSAPFSFSLTVGEWSWAFGIGDENKMSLGWWGPYLSYQMTDYRADRRGGWFSAGISSGIYWEAP